MKKILKINSSARKGESVSRKLVGRLVSRLAGLGEETAVIERDLADISLPMVTESMIGAFYTLPSDRSDEQNEEIAISEMLVGELLDADIIVLGVPIYNFGVPAALKAWVELVARVGVTFSYSEEDGLEGLLKNKVVYIIVTSNLTGFRSEVDYASDYLEQFLRFLGIDEFHFIPADQLLIDGEERIRNAEEIIQAIGV